MGRHTAPIPIVTATATALLPVGPVTDPHLFDRPLPPAAVSRPVPAPVRPRIAPAPWIPAPAPAIPVSALEEVDGIDDRLVDAVPRSVRSVRQAEEAAAAEELPPQQFPRIRDLVFGGASLLILAVAVGAALAR